MKKSTLLILLTTVGLCLEIFTTHYKIALLFIIAAGTLWIAEYSAN